jgi:hypothetical protein
MCECSVGKDGMSYSALIATLPLSPGASEAKSTTTLDIAEFGQT